MTHWGKYLQFITNKGFTSLIYKKLLEAEKKNTEPIEKEQEPTYQNKGIKSPQRYKNML